MTTWHVGCWTFSLTAVIGLSFTLWLAAPPAVKAAETAVREGTQAMAYPVKSGEPYELLGKRLVFTNWYYVRPGTFAWVDAQGHGVTVVGSQGPWEARFRRYDSPHGIRLVAQPAERRGPVIQSERPWETTGIAVSSLIREGERYRWWGSCSGEQGGGTCYFESQDGVTWDRPELGLVDVEGQKTNLIPYDIGTVFSDPSAPPEERYKAVTLANMSYEELEAFKQRRPDGWEPRAKREDVGHVYFIRGAVSPDGIHWTVLPEPLVVEHSDTQIVAYYDERLRQYVIYTRNWMVGPQSERAQEGWGRDWWSVGRRSIGRTESDDFRHFPLSQLILTPPSDLLPSDVLYTNCKTTIPGAPDQHVMFPTVWHTSDDTTSVVMAASHDGRVWNFVPGGAVFTTPPFGEWDGGCVFASPNLVELPNGDFVLPYTGYLFPHKYPRGQWKYLPGYLVWPKGRIVALEAPEKGELATVAIMPPGRRLRINAVTQRAGRLLVEVAGLNGAPLPGRSFAEADPIIGDQFRKPVTWQGQDDLGYEEGAPIILRFQIDRGKIFGLDFE